MNIMNKLIIPRTKLTIRYILLELEEIAREELYRIKMIKKNKARHAKKQEAVCPSCKKIIDLMKTSPEMEKCNSPCVPTTSGTVHKTADNNSVKVCMKKPESEFPTKTILKTTKTAVAPTTSMDNNKLKKIKQLLGEIINQGKNVIKSGISNIDVNEFISICEEAKINLEKFSCTNNATCSEKESKFIDRFNNLKKLLDEVIDLTSEFRNGVKTTKNFEKADCKLKTIKYNVSNDSLKEEKQCHSNETKKVCALSPSVEAFLKAQETVQIKTDSNTKTPYLYKLNNSQDRDDKLENVKFEGMPTFSMDKLTACCKDFKEKLEAYKKRVRSPLISSTKASVSKLFKPVENNSSCCQTTDKDFSASECAPNFTECCKDIKKLCEDIGDDVNEGSPEISKDISVHIDCIINILKQLKDERITKEDAILFLKNFGSEKQEKTDCQICSSVTDEVDTNENEDDDADCTEYCTCKKENVVEKCSNCKNEDEKSISLRSPPPSIDEFKKDEEKETKMLCENCSKLYEQASEQKQSLAEESEINQSNSVEDTLGLYERKEKKIVRVTRTLNDDGTIREQTETIIITKKRHDPNTTTLVDNNDKLDYTFVDFEDKAEERKHTVNFMRKVKSEGLTKSTTMAKPAIRKCISHCKDIYKDQNIPSSSHNF